MDDGYYFYLEETIKIRGKFLSHNIYFLLFCPGNSAFHTSNEVEKFAKTYNLKLAGGYTYELGGTHNFYVNIKDGKIAADTIKDKIQECKLKQMALVI